jgi:hypothetical protein
MDKLRKSPTFVALVGISSVTLVVGLALFMLTAQAGYLWWLAGLSMAIGVGAVMGSSEPSVSQNGGFVGIVVALVAYGPVRIPIRLLMGKPIDPGHELALVLYCFSLVAALASARWISRRGYSKTEAI